MGRKIMYVDQNLFDYFYLGDTLLISNHLSSQNRLGAIASVIAMEV